MAAVNYGRNSVSDKDLREVLEAICKFSGNNINVIMGERIPPKGHFDNKNPHHLGLGVDFHMEGAPDQLAYRFIKSRREGVFSCEKGYQLIWHGPFISAQRPCLCLARFARSNSGIVTCIKGGDRYENMDKYWVDDSLPIYWGRGSYVGDKLADY